MAICVEEVESWLPSEFLVQEEDLLTMDKLISDSTATEFKLNPSLSLFPTEFPYEFDSLPSSMSLSSPDESVVGSTEAESGDEDDFLAGLTRRLTQQLTVQPEKKWAVAGSPESTLSGMGSWSVSSNGSPNGVLSPPTTPFWPKNDTRDLIYAAAGQVARLKMNNSNQGTNMRGNYQGSELFGPVKSQNPDMGALKNNNTNGFYSNQSFGHTVGQVNQYSSQPRQEQVLKPQQCHSVWGRQQVKVGWQGHPPPQHHHQQLPHQHQSTLSHYMQQQQQIQGRGRSVIGCENGRCVRPLGLPQSAWPPLQVQANQQPKPPQHHSGTTASTTGMRAVFLGGSGIKKECAGTGVFLPRRYGNPPEPKKKSACSTVLLPAKVVQALNLNFEDMNLKGDALPRFNSSLASDYDALILRRNALLAQQKRNLHPECVLNHELRLPQEWQY